MDFAWLWSVHQTGAFFVTRLKKSLNWTRVVSHPVDKSIGLRCDQEVLLSSLRLKNLYPNRLRRISFRDETQNRTLVFLTTNFTLPSETIATLYKARWEIELFFKWIKLNLGVNTFYGTSPNAGKDPNLDRYDRFPQTCHSQRTLSFGVEPFKIITLFGG